jgi:heat shock protein HslJ
MKHVKQPYPVLVLLVLAALLLAACGTPPAPAVPTAAPGQATPEAQSAQPTQPAQAGETPAAQPQTTPEALPQLSGKVWQWTKTAYSDGRTITVPNPANYTIEFFPVGDRVAVKADCNNVVGTFTADASNMTITLGPSTMAMCPPGSLDSEYIRELGEVAQYLIQGDSLVLNFKMDSGGMTFTAAAAQPAQPAQPSEMPGQDLGGQPWQWVKSTLNDGQTFNPSNPADYTIEFSMVDGRVNIKADCNNAIGEFMTDGQSLQIMIGGVTRAMCPPGSLSEEFLKELSEVGSYQVQGTTLTLTMGNGAMTLTAGQPAAQQLPSQPAAPASLEGPTWNWIKTAYSSGSTTTAPDPAKYTLKFDQAAKRFIFVADCNNGSGSYTVSGQNLTMHVEGMTRAICPPPSDEYVRMLDQVASYKIEGSTLYLALKMDAGSMTFTTGGAQPAPGAGSAATPSAPAGSNLQRLTSGVWKWQQSADSSGQTWTSPNPANYTLQFNSNGTLAAQVDCNRSSGTYQADETNLTITFGPTTLMACPPPTLDNVFRQQLSQVSSYFFDGDSLVLLWQMDSGSMKFTQ